MARFHLNLGPTPSNPLAPRAAKRYKRKQRRKSALLLLFSDTIRTIHCPLACGKCLSGPSHGYLLASNLSWRTHSLLNPLTKDEVSIDIRRRRYRHLLVCMGPDPIGTDDCIAFINNDFSKAMGFHQPRNCEWNYVQLPLPDSMGGLVCSKGMYYMNEPGTGATVVFNIACGSSFMIPPPKTLAISDHVYLIESAGKILRIVKQEDLSLAVSTSSFCFDIYRPRWKRSVEMGKDQ